MTKNKTDFLVIGAGIIGISIAIELRKRNPKAKITLIEKESSAAYHSSGRNSGVLHAGFYYTADSLKAKFTKQGNEYLKDYCKTKGLRINHCGKLVVTRNEADLKSLEELFVRAKNNGVVLEELSTQDAQSIEPRVVTHKKAGWSPNTSVVDPLEVMKSLVEDANKAGIEILFDCVFIKKTSSGIETSKGLYECGFLINAAGLYADKIAKEYDFSQKYRILPFKGLYIYNTNPQKCFNTHIYPVPNLKNPFLGVHHTLTVDGNSKIGPTAIPAFWREQYSGFSRFNLAESVSIISDEIKLLFMGGFDFRSLAIEEIKKYSKTRLISEAAEMATDVKVEDYMKWGKPGIRAQLLNIETKKLEMDFKFEGDSNSLHVLNAVSPAFTCSQPFAQYICDHIGQNIRA